jgi:serine/threonine protein kinase
VILYELLTGRTPWEGTSPQIAAQIVSDDAPDVRNFAPVPDPIAAAIRMMLQRDPAQRYTSVREVAAAIAPYAVPSSLGASIAEQLVAGYSSPRMLRPAYASFSQPPPPPSSLVTMPLATSLTPVQRPTASPAKSKGRVFVVAGAVLGVLAAVGIVLAWAALRARGTVVAKTPAATVEASAPVATIATAPPAASTSEVAPPPTTRPTEEPVGSAAASSVGAPHASPSPRPIRSTTPATTTAPAGSATTSPSGAPAFL